MFARKKRGNRSSAPFQSGRLRLPWEGKFSACTKGDEFLNFLAMDCGGIRQDSAEMWMSAAPRIAEGSAALRHLQDRMQQDFDGV